MFIRFTGAGVGHGPWQVDGPSNDKPGEEDELGNREDQDSQMGEDECEEESKEDQNENENECEEESEEDENECEEESEDDDHIEDTSLSGSDTDEDVNFWYTSFIQLKMPIYSLIFLVVHAAGLQRGLKEITRKAARGRARYGPVI